MRGQAYYRRDWMSNGRMGEDHRQFWYPTKEDVIRIHDDIVESDPESESGIEDPERIEYAVDFIEHGHVGEGPETVHEKAFHLMRLLASNHWFVNGNKRTALNTTELFYLFNGYEFDYGEDVRSMLKLFSVREDLIDREVGVDYLADQTSTASLEDFDVSNLVSIIRHIFRNVEIGEVIGVKEGKHGQWEFTADRPPPDEWNLDFEDDDEDDHNDYPTNYQRRERKWLATRRLTPRHPEICSTSYWSSSGRGTPRNTARTPRRK